MCQYKNMCKNFVASKDNSASCTALCVRNPLLNYEIPDMYLSSKRIGNEAMIEFEQPDRLIKAPLQDLKSEMEKVKNDSTMSMGQRRDKISNIQMQNEVARSQDIQPLEDIYSTTPGENVKSDKEDKLKEEVGKLVQENIGQNSDPSGNWSVPKRRRSSTFRRE